MAMPSAAWTFMARSARTSSRGAMPPAAGRSSEVAARRRRDHARAGPAPGPRDPLARALRPQRPGPRRRAHSAADARGGLRGQHADQAVVGAAAHGGVEIDHLDLRESGELAQHLLRGIAFQRLLPALNQLDHLAVHQIDARDNHAILTGMPRRASSSFNWLTV